MKDFWSLKGYWQQALIVFLLVFVGAFFFAGGYWRYDDPQIAYFAYKYSPWDYFFVPEVHRIFSSVNFTPWVIFSFYLDQLISLSPGFAYFHHGVALGLLAAMYLKVVRFWLPPYMGLFCVVLFISGLPFLASAMHLMVRHYIEGMMFCLLTIIFYVGWLKGHRSSVPQLMASAIFYMLSMLSKEVYAPLPLVLFFMPEGIWRKKIQAAFVYAFVGALYIAWRFYMIGAPSSIWTDALDVSFVVVISKLLTAPVVLYGFFGGCLLLVAILGHFSLELRSIRWQRVACFVAIVLVTAVPIVPLAVSWGFEHHVRYIFVPHAVMCFIMCLSLNRLSTGYASSIAVVVGMLFYGLTANSTLNRIQPLIESAKAYDAQSQFLWESEDDVAIVPNLDYLLSYYHYAFLADLKLELTGRKSPPVIANSVFAERYAEGRSFYSYNINCHCMEEFDYEIGSEHLLGSQLQANAQKGADYISWDLKISPRDGDLAESIPLPDWILYNYCAILLDNGRTTGFLLVGCKGSVLYDRSIRGYELLSSDLVFMLEEKDGVKSFSRIHEGVK